MTTDYRWLRALGNALRDARESKGFRQRELARLIDYDNSLLNRVENGKQKPPDKLIDRSEEKLELSKGSLVATARSRYPNVEKEIPRRPGPSTKDATTNRIRLSIDPLGNLDPDPQNAEDYIEVRIRVESETRYQCHGVRFGLLGENTNAGVLRSLTPKTEIDLWRRPGGLGALELTLHENLLPGDRMTWIVILRIPRVGRLLLYPVAGSHISDLLLDYLIEKRYGVDTAMWEAKFLTIRMEYSADPLRYGFRWPDLDLTPVERMPLHLRDLEIDRAYGIQWRQRTYEIDAGEGTI